MNWNAHAQKSGLNQINKSGHTKCRAGLAGCYSGPRIVRSMIISQACLLLNWQPRALTLNGSVGGGLQQSDIIAAKNGTVWVIDVTITGDGTIAVRDREHENKCHKYQIPDTRYSDTGYKRAWYNIFQKFTAERWRMSEVGLGKGEFEPLAVRCLENGSRLWQLFNESTAQVWN